MSFQIEEVNDDGILYYRVHKTYIREGEVIPGAFRERGEGEEKGMSCDWNKYSSGELCRKRAQNPEDNGIVESKVLPIRECKMPVIHHPYDDNQSHSNVKNLGEKLELTENRRILIGLFSTWTIKIENAP